jgi:hypothetical protein
MVLVPQSPQRYSTPRPKTGTATAALVLGKEDGAAAPGVLMVLSL